MTEKQLIVFRTDSSALIGSGHVIRCVTLADELRRRGAETLFVCRDHPGNITDRIEHAGHRLCRLPAPPTRLAEAGNYLDWLGVDQGTDASETLQCLAQRRAHWVVVDHYALDVAWERCVRPFAERVLVIDDLANREHVCDLLLDQGYYGELTAERYDRLTPPSCQRLLGPRYALLQPEYARLRAALPARGGHICRVLVFFGGSDPTNQTEKVLEALSTPELRHLAADVVVGSNHPDPEGIAARVGGRPYTTLHRDLPTIAGLMARADLAIGAGGATTWERFCLGLPSVVIVLADNQRAFTEALATEDRQILIPSGTDATTAEWRTAIAALLREPDVVARLSTSAAHVSDGAGARRVAVAMLQGAASAAHFRLERVRDRPLPDTTTGDAGPESAALVAEDECGVVLGRLACALDPDSGDVLIDVRREDVLPYGGLGDAVVKTGLPCLRSVVSRLGGDGSALPTSAAAGLFFRLQSFAGKALLPSGDPLRITLLSDADSWVGDTVAALQMHWLENGHRVRWINHPSELVAGDVCFALGCSKILSPEHMKLNAHNLIIHESALPDGRGWSPMTWQILEGRKRICVTLFEAVQEVDAGPIYAQQFVDLDGTELVADWRGKLANAVTVLCQEWITEYPDSARNPRPQKGEPTFYSRRRPADSRLDPDRPLKDQFDLLRVVDNVRYPAFFDMRGKRYKLFVQPEE